MKEPSGRTGVRLYREYLFVVLLAGCLYYLSVAPGVVWQDGGLAQMRVLKGDYVGELGLALAHPLFYIIAQAFQLLPFHDSAFKTNLVPATASVLAVANIYLLVSWMFAGSVHRRFLACLGAVTAALAHTFWQQSSLAEASVLSAVILTFELLMLYRFSQTFQLRWYLAAWFLNGLECSNHMLACLTAGVILIWSIILVRRGVFPWYWILVSAVVWIIGALPYEYFGYMHWRAGTPLADVVYSMLFGEYQHSVLNMRITTRMLITAGGVIVLNFPTPNIALIPIGLIWGRKIVAGCFVSLLVWVTLFHLVFAIRYDIKDQPTFFALPTLILSLWVPLGAAVLIETYNRVRQRRFVLMIFAVLPPLLYGPLPWIVEASGVDLGYRARIPYRDEARYFFWPWKTGYRGPQQLADEVFGLAAPDAIIVADSTSRRPFDYYQLFAGVRPDVMITPDPCPDTAANEKVRCLAAILRRRDVYIVRATRPYCPSWILDSFQLERAGPVYRVVGPNDNSSAIRQGRWDKRFDRKPQG